MGYFAAEKLGIPSVLASPFPMHKTKEQTSIILYGRTKSNPLINTVSYSMLQGMLWLASKNSVKGFWKKHFGSVFDIDEKDRISKLVIDAISSSGRRGILCGMGKINNLPDHVFAVDSIPHSWLFDRVSAVRSFNYIAYIEYIL